MSEKRYPLSGIKVVDLSTVVAAPTAAELLCAFGADVVKVETLEGDGQRFLGSFQLPAHDECNPLYTVQNSNKKHVAANLKTDEGKVMLHKLLADADIFLTNIRTAGLERLGLDYETLKEKYPKLIYAHFSGYGPIGPNKDDPGYDSTVFWLRGGMTADWNIEGVSYPFNPTYAFGDTVTASSFFAGILLALQGRDKYGEGTKVESSLYSSGLWCNGQGVVITQFGRKTLNPNPAMTTNPCNGYYLCGDGVWFNICNVKSYDIDVLRISEVLGIRDQVEADERFLTEKGLVENGCGGELRAKFEAAFRTKPAAEWKKLFQQISMPCDVAVRTNSICKDEQAIVNGYVEEVTYQDGTKVMMPVPPMFLSNYDRREPKAAGKIGEDTDEVLAGIGYSADEIAALKEAGVIK
ncbi:MAG: CoA transferase [Firmicutes bacterium]|nr:CoA transferase [Bacillota bacterium]MBQ3123092.1 CoA transferase [Bacillota bacterium]